MKLIATRTPYSSTVGGGLMLTDDAGRARFMVLLAGTTNGITKEENDTIASRVHDLLNEHGLEVPDR